MNDLVIADVGIRQLHARFIDAVWRKDTSAFGDCFSETAEWKIAGLHIYGRIDIAGMFRKLITNCERVQIIMGTPVLEVGQGIATGRINITELAKMVDGAPAMTLGVYYDRYVETDGQWRFLWRHFSLHYRGPTDLSASLVDSPDYGPPLSMPSADEPTLTRKVLI